MQGFTSRLSGEDTLAALLDGKTEIGEMEHDERRRIERRERERIQVAFAHLRNLLTPLAAEAVYFSHDALRSSRLTAGIALSADSTIQFHDP